MLRKTLVRKTLFAITAAALAVIGGCIVSDEVTTLTIRPDGSADWVKFRSNIRSSETGEKGAQELKGFVEDFDAHRDADYQEITKAGGTVLESRWLRREEPYSTVTLARFPGMATLVEYCTQRGDKGEVIAQPRYTQDGKRRKLAITYHVPKDFKPQEKPTPEELRQERASGFSETRVVVAGGQILSARGFIVAADKRSALLDNDQLREWLRTEREKIELFLEWELPPAN